MQEYIHAKFETPSLHSVRKKANIKKKIGGCGCGKKSWVGGGGQNSQGIVQLLL